MPTALKSCSEMPLLWLQRCALAAFDRCRRIRGSVDSLALAVFLRLVALVHQPGGFDPNQSRSCTM
jgi:hypothetical protein